MELKDHTFPRLKSEGDGITSKIFHSVFCFVDKGPEIIQGFFHFNPLAFISLKEIN